MVFPSVTTLRHGKPEPRPVRSLTNPGPGGVRSLEAGVFDAAPVPRNGQRPAGHRTQPSAREAVSHAKGHTGRWERGKKKANWLRKKEHVFAASDSGEPSTPPELNPRPIQASRKHTF